MVIISIPDVTAVRYGDNGPEIKIPEGYHIAVLSAVGREFVRLTYKCGNEETVIGHYARKVRGETLVDDILDDMNKRNNERQAAEVEYDAV